MISAVMASTGPIADLFRTSVGPLAGLLSRPVVQWQLLTIALILLFSWFAPRTLFRRRAEAEPHPDPPAQGFAWRRWAFGLRGVLSPLTALALLFAAEWLFQRLGNPSGLLVQTRAIIWLWLLYRVIASLIYARYGDDAKPYRRRLITPVFVLTALWIGLDIFPWVTNVGDIKLKIGGVAFALGGAISALLILYVFLVGGWLLEQVLNRRLPSRLEADQNTVASLAILGRYAVSALGVVFALGAIGFDATSLAIVAGGLSVGIGIGLQDIVANFFSGLILLAEQSLRPGDVIDLNGRLSTVEKISLRATTVRTLDNVEKVIPNAAFTTGEVTTLTKTEPLVRALLPIGVSYKSDPHEVRKVIVGTAAGHHLVLAEPAPVLLFRGYGDSSLDFELSVWINQPDRMPLVKSDLYFMLWDALAEHDIEIPFPQRDLNLRGGWEELLDGSEPVSGLPDP